MSVFGPSFGLGAVQPLIVASSTTTQRGVETDEDLVLRQQSIRSNVTLLSFDSSSGSYAVGSFVALAAVDPGLGTTGISLSDDPQLQAALSAYQDSENSFASASSSGSRLNLLT